MYTPRFSLRIVDTFERIFHAPLSDQEHIKRVVGLWAKNDLLSPEVIETLFEICQKKTGSPPGMLLKLVGACY